MMTARQKLQAAIESRPTAQLIEIARELNLRTTDESILVSSEVANVLETRMDSDSFLALMNELEAELCAA